MSADADTMIAEILSLILERPVAVGECVMREEEAGWDSLKHLEIVFAVEAALDVTFTPEDMAAIDGTPSLLTTTDARRAS